MLLIYNIGVRLYYFIIKAASLFNNKAKLWIKGRNEQFIEQFLQPTIWFHFASLGEFEQGRPVLEQIKRQYPVKKIVITFFSPSGYEVRKNTPLADAVYYLPLDTPGNAFHFIYSIRPEMAIFTKYEYWYHFFRQLHQQQISIYIISGIFRPDQVFFKWYGRLHRKMLTMVSHFFVQDKESADLLASLNINKVSVSGDTRFDRVWENAQNPRALPVIEAFKNGEKVFIGGSTWPQDEELIVSITNRYPDWKFIFAPHEITSGKLAHLERLLKGKEAIRFSAISAGQTPVSDYRILIIDNIGMLSALYRYAEVAFIGGGFGAGIHNALEAAAFGLPVIFGPKYQKFREAREIIALKAGFSVNNAEELATITDLVMKDDEYRQFASEKIKTYVKENTGATGIILREISPFKSPPKGETF